MQKLAALDLRRNVDVPGVSRHAMRQHKADAKKMRADEGKPVPKASYGRAKASGKHAKAKPKKAPVQEVSELPDLEKRWLEGQECISAEAPQRQRFFRRLLGCASL